MNSLYRECRSLYMSVVQGMLSTVQRKSLTVHGKLFTVNFMSSAVHEKSSTVQMLVQCTRDVVKVQRMSSTTQSK